MLYQTQIFTVYYSLKNCFRPLHEPPSTPHFAHILYDFVISLSFGQPEPQKTIKYSSANI